MGIRGWNRSIQAAAEEGDNELVPALCDFCADLDAVDDEEVTPLLAACCRGEMSVVPQLHSLRVCAIVGECVGNARSCR